MATCLHFSLEKSHLRPGDSDLGCSCHSHFSMSDQIKSQPAQVLGGTGEVWPTGGTLFYSWSPLTTSSW